MKPARVDRDMKPEHVRHGVVVTDAEDVDRRRLRRIAEILADILDTPSTPEEHQTP